MNLDLEIENFPTRHLSETKITGCNTTGRPNFDSLILELDTSGKDWFFSTPQDNSEFRTQNSGAAFQAQPGPESGDRYDFFSIILPELPHFTGVIHSNPGCELLRMASRGLPPALY